MIGRPCLRFEACGGEVTTAVSLLHELEIDHLACAVWQIPGRERRGELVREDLEAFLAPLMAAGIRLAAVNLGWVARADDGTIAEDECARWVRELAVLADCGVGMGVLFEGGTVPSGADPWAFRATVHASYARLAAAGARLAVHGLWGPRRILADLDSYCALAASVPNPALGFCLCSGTLYQAGEDPVALIEALPRRIHLVHLRDARGRGGECETMLIGSGRVDVAAIARALERIGYEGPVQCEHVSRVEHEAVWSAGFLRGLHAVGAAEGARSRG